MQTKWLPPSGFHYKGKGKDVVPSFLDPRDFHSRPWDISSSGRTRDRTGGQGAMDAWVPLSCMSLSPF